MPKFLSIKNYKEYQHYKHRNPPWIKLHLSILDDPDFLALSDASKWHYIGLILLASRHENAIKPDMNYIKGRLGLTEKLSLSARFLKDHVLAPNASVLHTNADSETETEKSRVESKPSASASAFLEWVEELKKNAAYSHINFEAELGKMDAWLSLPRNKGRQKTKRFVLNWLNKIERPVAIATLSAVRKLVL